MDTNSRLVDIRKGDRMAEAEFRMVEAQLNISQKNRYL